MSKRPIEEEDDFDDEDDDTDEPAVDSEQAEEIRKKVRGIDGGIQIVSLAIAKWIKKYSALADDEGKIWLELGYRATGLTIKRFHFEVEGAEKEDVEALAEDMVYTAALDLVNVEAEIERYAVRLYNGNESTGFRLTMEPEDDANDRDEETDREREEPRGRSSNAMTRYGSRAMTRGGDRGRDEEDLFGPNTETAQNMFGIQTAHNIALAQTNNALAEQFVAGQREMGEMYRTIIRDQQERLNAMTEDRWNTMKEREDMATRRHEIEAEQREAEREAQRRENIEKRVEALITKVVLPLVANKLGFGGVLAQAMASGGGGGAAPTTMQAAAPNGQGDGVSTGGAPVVPQGGIPPAMHTLFGSIREEQFASLMRDGTITFDDDQKMALFDMMQALQSQYEASQGSQEG